MEILRRRLQIQTQGRAGIDRSIVFVTGTVTPAERATLRGVVFEVDSKVTALELFQDLRKLAAAAVAQGEVNRFLDALDKRSRTAPDESPTFEKFSTEWRETCSVNGGLTESMVAADESILRLHLAPYFGKVKVSEIGARDVDRYKAIKRQAEHQYGTGYSGKTLNNHVGVLHRIFEKAIEYGLIEKNPVGKKAWSRRESTPEDERPWWTPREEELAVAALESWRDTDPVGRMAIMVQLITGIRFSELRALEKCDLDLQAPGIWIRRSQARKRVGTPKNKRSRFQPVPKELVPELQAYSLRMPGQRLFPGLHGGALANNVLNKRYRDLCQQAGIRVITSHGVRHTVGSSFAAYGASQRTIATLLGHADTQTTLRYTHVQTEAAGALVEARWARLRPAEESK